MTAGGPITMPDSFLGDMEALQPLFDIRHLPEFGHFNRLFQSTLEREVEFSFAPRKDSLELTIEGRGPDFHDMIEQWLHYIQIPPDQIQAYRAINGFFQDTGTLVKTDFQHERAPSASIYFQTQVSAKLGAKFAKTLGLPHFPGELLVTLGKYLQRKGLFIGLDFRKAWDPEMAVFYLIPPRKARTGLLEGLIEAQKLLGLNPGNHETLRRFHEPLTAHIVGDLFVSMLLGKELHRLMKIDYDKASAPLVVRIIKELGLEEEEIRRFARVAKTFDTRVLNYFGMKYGEKERPSFKFYFKRAYNTQEGDEAEKLAHFLESTIWRLT